MKKYLTIFLFTFLVCFTPTLARRYFSEDESTPTKQFIQFREKAEKTENNAQEKETKIPPYLETARHLYNQLCVIPLKGDAFLQKKNKAEASMTAQKLALLKNEVLGLSLPPIQDTNILHEKLRGILGLLETVSKANAPLESECKKISEEFRTYHILVEVAKNNRVLIPNKLLKSSNLIQTKEKTNNRRKAKTKNEPLAPNGVATTSLLATDNKIETQQEEPVIPDAGSTLHDASELTGLATGPGIQKYVKMIPEDSQPGLASNSNQLVAITGSDSEFLAPISGSNINTAMLRKDNDLPSAKAKKSASIITLSCGLLLLLFVLSVF